MSTADVTFPASTSKPSDLNQLGATPPAPLKPSGIANFFRELSLHIKMHHPLLVAGFAILLIWGVSGKVQSAWATHEQHVFDKSNVDLQTKVLAASEAAQQASQEAKTNSQLAVQFATLVKKVTAENTRLARASESLREQLTRQQTVDMSLPLNDLSKRWQGLAALSPADVTAGADNVVVSPAGARATVAALESVPVLTQELKNSQDTVQADNEQIAGSGTVTAGLNTQVADLNKQVTALQVVNTASVATCDAKISAVKARNKKAIRKMFIRGLEIGAIAGGAITGYLLHKF